MSGKNNELQLYLAIVINTRDNYWTELPGATEYVIKLAKKENDIVANEYKIRKYDNIEVVHRI